MRNGTTTIAVVAAVIAAASAGVWAWQRHAAPTTAHRQAVLERLFDAQSALFRDEFQPSGSTTTWCGQVNSRNLMGGMAGYTRYVVLFDPRWPNDPARADVYLDQEGDNKGAPAFALRWNSYCH